MKFIFAFCEGPHDVAFLYKILKTEGYKSHNKDLGEYPGPIDRFLISEAAHSSLEEVNIQSANRRLLPIEVMRKAPDQMVFLYALGGDQRKAERLRILRFLQDSFAVSDPDAFLPGEGHTAAAIYFFDADEAGKQARYETINDELAEVWGQEFQLSPDAPVAGVSGLQLGGIVFTATGQPTGKLEDVLLPLMEQNNEPIFEAAQAFLDQHYDENRCRKLLRLERNNGLIRQPLNAGFQYHNITRYFVPLSLQLRPNAAGVMEEIRSNRTRDRLKFDRSKSIIGIVGQLQQSGKGNAPIIRDTDFIDLNKIQGHEACQAIVAFIRML